MSPSWVAVRGKSVHWRQKLEKLNDMKFQLKEENTAYLAQHTDFNDLLDEFVGEIFQKKPKDIIGFGANFFNKKLKQTTAASQAKDTSKGKLKPLVMCGPSGAGGNLTKDSCCHGLVSAHPSY